MAASLLRMVDISSYSLLFEVEGTLDVLSPAKTYPLEMTADALRYYESSFSSLSDPEATEPNLESSLF